MIREPYRALFPLGLLWGALGVALWLLYFIDVVPFPIFPHSYIMIFGFFLSFVSGFLMTALPKMTGTFAATAFERAGAMGLISAGVTCAFLNQLSMAYGFGVCQIAFLLWFGLRRPHSRTGNRPSGFIFIPTALLWAAFGASVQTVIYASIEVPEVLADFARVAIQEAFLLNLIVGIGGRLIPFLTRVQAVSPQEKVADTNQSFWIVFAFLNLSFFLEGAGFQRTSWSLRAVVLIFAATSLFKLHLRRAVSSQLGNVPFRSDPGALANFIPA